MANQITSLADVQIDPAVFANYVINKTTEVSKLVKSGIVTANPLLDRLITGGGQTLVMPSWNKLSGNSQVITETKAIETRKITTRKEIATILYRANGWASHELVGYETAEDPQKVIADQVADFWAEDEEDTLIAELDGMFAANDMDDLILNEANSQISGNLILDGKQKLGDNAGKLRTIAMHSAVFTELQKQNLINSIPPARGEIEIPTYLGYNVLFDDKMPYLPKAKGVYTITIGGTYATNDTVTADGVTYTVLSTDTTPALVAAGLKSALDSNSTFAGKFDIAIEGAVITVTQKTEGTGAVPTVSKLSTNGTIAVATVKAGQAKAQFTTYLFAAGVIGRGNGIPVTMTPVETDRDSAASTNYLFHRRAYVLHPKGMKWLGASVALETPDNTELAMGANWGRVAETKEMGIVKIVHTI